MVALANLQSREGSSLCRALAIALMGTTLLIALEANAEDVKPAELADEVDFARDILPILQKRCLSCHGDKARGGLRLTSRMAALEGGDRGPTLVPGKSGESLVVKAVTETDPEGLFMPPKGTKRLSVTEVRLLKAWIDQGAKWPEEREADTATEATNAHWAFQPVVRPSVPSATDTWPLGAIDRFVLRHLSEQQIAPSPPADRASLARRLHLDLTGLPPEPSVVEAFIANDRPDAYDRLVDQLLASPAYGERWGRHWLDSARYADSAGHEMDGRRPIWKYRDWVTDALNRDLPFDEFTVEQLAGDLLPGATRTQRVATGFNRNNMGTGPEGVVDRTNTVGRVFLGLTIGCAQCHSHKFDPISQREYYQLFAFFNNSDDPLLEFATAEQITARNKVRQRIGKAKKKLDDHGAEVGKGIKEWEANLTAENRAKLDPTIQAILAVPQPDRTPPQAGNLLRAFQEMDTQYRELKVAHESIAKTEPKFDSTLVLNEREHARETTIFIRGDFQSHGDKVEPSVPRVLPPMATNVAAETEDNENKKGRRFTRLDLARWLVQRDHPLTARVAVNRIWQHYFGLGLVETEDDFGTQGEPPSHPKLLDYLASELMETGWSLKRLHRSIVTSATYQQSSKARRDLVEIDPRKRRLAGSPRRRVEAEAIRDQSLSVAGLLNHEIGGPAVFPYQVEGVMDGRADKSAWVMSRGADLYRRGVYIHFWRLTPHPFLKVFDAPDAVESCTRRTRSNTALQALTMLNHPWFVDCARALGRRVRTEPIAGSRSAPDERIDFAFRLCLGRSPTRTAATALKSVFADELADVDTPNSERELIAWTAVARALLNLDEFITRE